MIALGGVVGFNLYARHIKDCTDTYARPEHLLPHMEHFLSLGGEKHLAIGGDLDGAALPAGMSCVSDVAQLVGVMQEKGYDIGLIRDIFSRNALRFFEKYTG